MKILPEYSMVDLIVLPKYQKSVIFYTPWGLCFTFYTEPALKNHVLGVSGHFLIAFAKAI